MATGTSPTTSSAPAEVSESERLIERQLVRVRRQIRIADFVTSSLMLVAGVLSFFLVTAAVDHWIVGLGGWGRWAALIVLLGGSAWFIAARIVPFLVLSINPAFAAQTIERSEPSLKNSLLNYLLLRQQPASVHQRVLDAVRLRAAADVSRVAIDQAVDRSNLIRAGYVLVGIMVLGAAYKIFSPKDPLQTARRIVSPWADIARPARVTIESVEPADAEFFHGQTVNVSAVVRGVGQDEPVTVVFSTADGQTMDRAVDMKLDSAQFRHIASLPPDKSGLRQDLHYRLRAGDCVTREFHIRAVAAPMIEVQAVDYQFPAYTRRAPETMPRQGDIQAVEGTHITVRTRTNQPIRSALVEFQSDTPASADAARHPTPATQRLPMEFQEMSASRTFLLELTGDRRSPRHLNYQLTFENTKGRRSSPPVVHRIVVMPDLAPEVEFLTPARERVEVPLGGEQKIETRAIDPDYGLSVVRLKGIRGETEVFHKTVHEVPAGQVGQVVSSFLFRPREFGLNAGDQLKVSAEASDNRTKPGSDSPEPNRVTTRPLTLVIVPDPASADPQDKPENSGQNSEKPDAAKDPQAGSKDDKQSGSQDKQEKKDGSQDKQSGSEPDKNGEPKEQPGGKDDQAGSAESGDKGSPQSKPSQEQDGGKQGGGSGSQQSGESKSKPGQGGKGSESGGNTPQDDGQGAQGSSPGENTGGKGQQREGKPGGTRSQPAHDGDVFEKALRRMSDEQGGESGDKKQDSDSAGNDGAQGEPDSSPKPPGGQQPQAEPSKSGNAGGTDASNPDDKGSTQDRPAGDPAGRSPTEKDGSPKEGTGAKQPDENQGAGPKRDVPSGEGGKTAKGGMERPEKQQPSPPAGADGEKKPGLSDNGESGAGQNSKEKDGSGSVDEIAKEKIENRDRRKSKQPENQDPQEPGDPGSSKSKHQSDSEGAQSGDESGGGKKGSGQGANQPGKDSAGSNSASDDGLGSASESGKGNSSKTGGDDRDSAAPTGQSGSEKGEGSKASDAAGDKSAGEKGGTGSGASPPQGDPQQQKRDENKPSGGSGSKTEGSSGVPTGGGVPGDRPVGTPPPDGDVPPGDPANLDYARRATDMVLDYLEQEKTNPDQQLLDELGWKPKDLEAFVERWKKLKEAAQEDPAAQRELDESLRSLGLRPEKDTRRTAKDASDETRGMRESGVRSAPPPSYRDQFNSFKKGASRGTPSRSSP